MTLNSSLIKRVVPLVEELSLTQQQWNDCEWATDYLQRHGGKTSADIGTLRRMKRPQLLKIVQDAVLIVQTAQQELDEETMHEDVPQNEVVLQDVTVTANQLNQQLSQKYHVVTQAQRTTTSKKSKKRKATTENDAEEATEDTKYVIPTMRYSDLGGLSKPIEEIRELIEAPLRHPEIYQHLRIAVPCGILLHGPPGCGKTKLAQAIAGECQLPLLQISAPAVVSGMSGESEKKIRAVFRQAKQLAPCLLFIDEIDAITPKRETAQREMERRIVAQLLTCMDDLAPQQPTTLGDGTIQQDEHKMVIVVGATNRPDALDSALRRAGRFDREICVGIPDQEARESIMWVQCRNLRLSNDFDYARMAQLTPGYVGADLMALVTAAGVNAVKRIFGQLGAKDENFMTDTAINKQGALTAFLNNHPEPLTNEELEPLSIAMDDFMAALLTVQPSSKREGFASVPDVTWSDIGALALIRDELRLSVVEPIKHPQLFKSVGIVRPSGVLLWGPPGNGKTMLAKAVANESHCNFISVKGPELLNKFVGESERGVRQVFARARASAPCVIFFDEIDALCPRRGGGSDSQTSERVVNQLLTELDGMDDRKQVFIIAATNRPDILDRAILRPGRFDKLLQVKLPTCDERHEILKTLCKNTPLNESVNLQQVAASDKCERFSGADLGSLIREAGMFALRGALTIQQDGQSSIDATHELQISSAHFDLAFEKVRPSVTQVDLDNYAKIERKLNG